MRRSLTPTLVAQQSGTAARPSRVRLLVLSLITLGTLINYLDRTVISVAAPLLARDLGLDWAVMGLAFSAFSWTYAAAQIPGGILLDRLGVRLTYFLSVTLWSICTALQGVTSGLGSLVSARLALGIAEAPAFPCNSRVLSTWFPQQERARATGVYSVGQYFGLAFLSPVLFWISITLGWRLLFVIVGTLGVLFGLLWIGLYRDPRNSRRVNPAELAHIAAGGGLGDRTELTRFEWRNIGFLLRQRQILGASIGQFASNSTLLTLLLRGAGLMYGPEPLLAPLAKAGTVRLVLQDWTSPGPAFHVYYPSHRQVPAGLRLLINLIREMKPLGF